MYNLFLLFFSEISNISESTKKKKASNIFQLSGEELCYLG